jgi:hypothetical protein
MIDEQNREYEEALAADREKAAQRAAEREAAEAAARAQEAAARAERWAAGGGGREGRKGSGDCTRALGIMLHSSESLRCRRHRPKPPRKKNREVQEAAERRLRDAVAAITARRAAAAAALPPEPAPGAPGAAAVRVRLPDGSNHDRRFGAEEPVEAVYGWVSSLEGCTFLRYGLVCNFPRRVYGPESRALTLQEAGLAPQGVLFVQVEDDEDVSAAVAAAAAAASGSG